MQVCQCNWMLFIHFVCIVLHVSCTRPCYSLDSPSCLVSTSKGLPCSLAEALFDKPHKCQLGGASFGWHFLSFILKASQAVSFSLTRLIWATERYVKQYLPINASLVFKCVHFYCTHSMTNLPTVNVLLHQNLLAYFRPQSFGKTLLHPVVLEIGFDPSTANLGIKGKVCCLSTWHRNWPKES